MHVVAHLTALTHLDLRGTDVSNSGMQRLRGLQHLRVLKLQDLPVDNDGMILLTRYRIDFHPRGKHLRCRCLLVILHEPCGRADAILFWLQRFNVMCTVLIRYSPHCILSGLNAASL